MKQEDWLIVDTETNGLSAPIYAVEIAAQRMRGWAPVGEPFRVLLNHDVPIDPMAEAVHGYSRAYLKQEGEKPIKAHKAFHAYGGCLPMVAYNLSFDWDRVLMPEYHRLQIPATGTKGFCALTLARRVIIESKTHRLETLNHLFKLSAGPAHRGLNDVRVVVRLFETLFKDRLEASGIQGFEPVARFACQTPVKRCHAVIRQTVNSRLRVAP